MNQTDGHIERAECEIHFSDAQEIHIIQDKVCQLRHVLQMNYTTFEAIGRRLSESGTSLTHTNDCIERQLSKLSRPYIIQTEAELHRIQTMLRRLKAASELVSTARMNLSGKLLTLLRSEASLTSMAWTPYREVVGPQLGSLSSLSTTIN